LQAKIKANNHKNYSKEPKKKKLKKLKKKLKSLEATKLLARVYAYNPIKPKGIRDKKKV
jgi:exonuclease VII large subunit